MAVLRGVKGRNASMDLSNMLDQFGHIHFHIWFARTKVLLLQIRPCDTFSDKTLVCSVLVYKTKNYVGARRMNYF